MICDAPYTVTFEFSCSAPNCDSVHRRTYSIPYKGETINPSAPIDWTQVNGQLYCPKHEVRVKIVKAKRK